MDWIGDRAIFSSGLLMLWLKVGSEDWLTCRPVWVFCEGSGPGGIAAALNGARSNSPSRFNGPAVGGAKDSFLNYFFG